ALAAPIRLDMLRKDGCREKTDTCSVRLGSPDLLQGETIHEIHPTTIPASCWSVPGSALARCAASDTSAGRHSQAAPAHGVHERALGAAPTLLLSRKSRERLRAHAL